MILPMDALAHHARPRAPRPAVVAEGLVKRFAVRRPWLQTLRRPLDGQLATAVDHVNFTAAEGEIVALLGPNGAGKTTLLKILSTLVVPDGGRAEVGGFDVVRQGAEVRKIIAPVAADERSLDWRLSARENLRFFGVLQGFRGASLRSRIDEVLAAVELESTGDKLVGSFSSGMKQRLLIARALLSRPRVLVLDEPTRSLDPLAARSFRAFLRTEIAEAQGCTVLLATHDPDEALELSDRVAVLHRGRLLTTGSPAELSRGFAPARYRVWTRTPDHRALSALLSRSPSTPVRSWDEQEGLAVLEFDLPAADADPGDVLASLVVHDTHVARFERVQLKLADLMERVVREVGMETTHA